MMKAAMMKHPIRVKAILNMRKAESFVRDTLPAIFSVSPVKFTSPSSKVLLVGVNFENQSFLLRKSR